MPKRRRTRKPQPRKPRQERARETVEAILVAATHILVRKGYTRTTTNEIARTAGVSVGSLHQYFPSKDAIAVELLRRNRERLSARIAARVGEMSETTFYSVVHTLISTLLAVTDSPRHNTPALADALTRLVVRYIGGRESSAAGA